jgi:hypothetical protein
VTFVRAGADLLRAYLDDVTEGDPCLSVKAVQDKLLDGTVVGWTRVDGDPRKQARRAKIFQMARLTHQVLACQIVATMLKDTGSSVLGIAEAVAHGAIDWCKNEGWFDFRVDQGLHALCKVCGSFSSCTEELASAKSARRAYATEATCSMGVSYS